MSDLKCCPFCGGKGQIRDEAGDPFDDIGRFYYVRCVDCRAQSGSKYASNGNDCPIFYEEVRQEWNQRSEGANS